MKKLEQLTQKAPLPIVMAGKFIPEICKTLESRRLFIKHKSSLSKRIVPPSVGVQPYVELKTVSDTENRKWFYAVDTKANDLLYVMHLNPLKIKFKRNVDLPDGLWKFAMYQGSVWRARGSVPKIGTMLPSALFWKLFSQRRNWFSDSTQSEDGKIFWERRIFEALQSGHLVYAVHFDEVGGVLVDKAEQIHSGDPIEHYWTYEDEKDESGMYWRFAIVHR